MRMLFPVFLLVISNVFMTLAWYGHLSRPEFKKAPLFLVILGSWALAFVEYCFQVPANRIGYQEFGDTAKLKTIQEVVTLAVFCGFSVLVMKEQIRWNHGVAFGLMVLAVFFVFKKW